jgi:hypothetical protein
MVLYKCCSLHLFDKIDLIVIKKIMDSQRGL